MTKLGPIGIFDSGVGGLSVAHAIRRLIPSENLIYFADQMYSPYGEKSTSLLIERAEYISQFLVEQGCKALVVACNTATTNTIENLRSKFSIPIIGVEPAIKVAALTTKTGRIGVLATAQTLASKSFNLLKEKHANGVHVDTVACPEFIPLVEQLNHGSQQAYDTAKRYVSPLLANGCDKVVLGCTHFSFLSAALTHSINGSAELIDTAHPVAVQVKNRLKESDLISPNSAIGHVDVWTSDCALLASNSIQNLWGEEIRQIRTV